MGLYESVSDKRELHVFNSGRDIADIENMLSLRVLTINKLPSKQQEKYSMYYSCLDIAKLR